MATGRRNFASYTLATATGVLGVGSLLLFGLFLWTGAFGLFEFLEGEPAILSFDAGLCLLFFLQHSVMVRRGFRTRLAAVLPEHYHGIVYTIASGIALLLLAALWQRSSADIYVLSGAGERLLRVVLLLSLGGVTWGIGSLERFDAFGIGAFLSPQEVQAAPSAKLTVRGPYRFVRHPFYCFAIVAVWATPTLSLDRLVFNTLFSAWILVGAKLEERDLLARFGEAYRLYQRTVPMLVPRIAQTRKPAATAGKTHA